MDAAEAGVVNVDADRLTTLSGNSGSGLVDRIALRQAQGAKTLAGGCVGDGLGSGEGGDDEGKWGIEVLGIDR